MTNIPIKILKIKVEKIEDAEELVLKYYRKMGYKAYKTKHRNHFPTPAFDKRLVDLYKNESGRPDIVIFEKSKLGDNKDIWIVKKLIEVKTGYDGIRLPQILWVRKHPQFKCEFCFVIQKIKNKKERMYFDISQVPEITTYKEENSNHDKLIENLAKKMD